MTQPSGPSAREIAAGIIESQHIATGVWPAGFYIMLAEQYLSLESRCTAQQQRIERLEAVIKAVRALDHENWCDILNNISDICNCVLSEVTLELKELDKDAP